MFTLDTNTILYYLQGNEQVARFLNNEFEKNTTLYVSTITEAELFRFSFLSAEEEGHINTFLKTVSIIPVDSHIARLAGFVGRSHGIKLADSIIGATGLFTGSVVATRNVRDFKRIEGLKVMKI